MKNEKVMNGTATSVAEKQGENPKPQKTRYSDAELADFKKLIEEKLDTARKELKFLKDQISGESSEVFAGNDPWIKSGGQSSNGPNPQEKEYLNQMAARQLKFIEHLEKALERIGNKTYGICRATDKLILKERLKAVPHATLSIEAKKAQAN